MSYVRCAPVSDTDGPTVGRCARSGESGYIGGETRVWLMTDFRCVFRVYSFYYYYFLLFFLLQLLFFLFFLFRRRFVFYVYIYIYYFHSVAVVNELYYGRTPTAATVYARVVTVHTVPVAVVRLRV